MCKSTQMEYSRLNDPGNKITTFGERAESGLTLIGRLTCLG